MLNSCIIENIHYNISMKIDLSLNYNIPEEIKSDLPLGYLICLALYVVLIPFLLISASLDGGLKDMVDLIVSAGVWPVLGMTFIFVLCPIYCLIKFLWALFKYSKNKKVFYSTPNIEYLKFNEDNIFFKNTCANRDLTIKKSNVLSVSLSGCVKIFPILKKGYILEDLVLVDNFSMQIKTSSNIYTVYPSIKCKQIKRKWNEEAINLDSVDMYELQIAFYKKYFDNIYIDININIDSETSNCNSLLFAKLKLETASPQVLIKYI